MERTLKITAIALVPLMTMGCVKTHFLVPDYDDDTKTVDISSLIIQPVTKHSQEESTIAPFHEWTVSKEYFLTEDSNCPKFQTSHYSLPFEIKSSTAMYELVLKDFKNQCDAVNISNVYLMQCDIPKQSFTASPPRKRYIVTASSGHEEYNSLSAMITDQKSCFNTFKNHFYKISSSKQARQYNREDGSWTKVNKSVLLPDSPMAKKAKAKPIAPKPCVSLKNEARESCEIHDDKALTSYRQKYKKQNTYKAFAQNDSNSWSWSTDKHSVTTAKEDALRRCNASAKRKKSKGVCTLINVNGKWL